MQLRPARPDDAETIAEVARDSWHAAYGDFLSTVTIDETVAEWYAPDALREQVDHGAFWVAVDEGRIVGFAHAFVGGDGTRPTLGRLYVRETEWGNGVGTALLNRVVAALDTDDSHESLSVIVFATNPVGRAFYESHGFDVVGRRTETFDGNDHEELILRAPLESFPVGR
ncbi:L-amino acid N-acyltransferase YncA [Halogranum gelatinilyticum]|uniref:L-amino acid N-acyltransferase YncA n=1 Tax=Halogranum gelatinilyticum TaxID=660521 RepID=A0A1G9W2C0_9EURY|nr:GNAT family N-acetyltransferase [Halogranum gelatinilyticum]SDM78215.1 L-amino acid N-acyltransferase YncA [Halogranum gelatinilyticum]